MNRREAHTRIAALLSGGVLTVLSGCVQLKKEAEPMAEMKNQKAALERFMAVRKFVPERFYPGAPNEEIRARLEAHVNALVGRLIDRLPEHLTKAQVLAEFKPTLSQFDREDSEEKDRVGEYMENVMEIFGIESSDGLLNTWRYGFDPNSLPQRPVGQ